MQKLSMAALGAVFIAVGTAGTAPATAALLDFSFTTQGGNTGSFTLDTDTPPAPQPASFGVGFPPGFSYDGAVTNFSFSAPYINLEGNGVTDEIADYDIGPDIPSEVLNPALPDGVLSGAVFPSGCS